MWNIFGAYLTDFVGNESKISVFHCFQWNKVLYFSDFETEQKYKYCLQHKAQSTFSSILQRSGWLYSCVAFSHQVETDLTLLPHSQKIEGCFNIGPEHGVAEVVEPLRAVLCDLWKANGMPLLCLDSFWWLSGVVASHWLDSKLNCLASYMLFILWLLQTSSEEHTTNGWTTIFISDARKKFPKWNDTLSRTFELYNLPIPIFLDTGKKNTRILELPLEEQKAQCLVKKCLKKIKLQIVPNKGHYIQRVVWHFNVPFWGCPRGDYFTRLSPREIITTLASPKQHILKCQKTSWI